MPRSPEQDRGAESQPALAEYFRSQVTNMLQESRHIRRDFNVQIDPAKTLSFFQLEDRDFSGGIDYHYVYELTDESEDCTRYGIFIARPTVLLGSGRGGYIPIPHRGRYRHYYNVYPGRMSDYIFRQDVIDILKDNQRKNITFLSGNELNPDNLDDYEDQQWLSAFRNDLLKLSHCEAGNPKVCYFRPPEVPYTKDEQ